MTNQRTPVAPVKALVRALRRAEEIDYGPEGLHSISRIDPACAAAARALEEKPEDERGPLWGEVILLKDNIDAVGLPARAGALALLDRCERRDAHLVERLRAADAIVLGKANMTEFANYTATGMPNGFSALGGQVRNPRTGGDPGGSSSGSGAAVGGGIVPMAIGTETMGSILNPSQHCGVVGVKPTAGLVSRSGILPLSATLDTAGPIARSVRDAARLLSVIAGYDPSDVSTSGRKGRTAIDYCAAIDPRILQGARIGIDRSIRPSESYARVFVGLKKRLRGMGAELVEIDMPKATTDAAMEIMRCEFADALRAFLCSAGDGAMRSLGDIVRFNDLHAPEAAPYGQDILLQALSARPGREYARALADREETLERALDVFASARLSAIVCAAGWSPLAPFTGLPYGTVPLAETYASGERAGCAIICPMFAESTLFSILAALEEDIAGRTEA